MDGMDKMMMDMDDCKRQIKNLNKKMDAVAAYLKMAFKYNSDSFEMVKPEDLTKEMQAPI